jgi:hypothetical protein
VGNGIFGMFRFGWDVSLTDCRRTERTPEDRKAQQTAKDEYPENTVDRPGEQKQTAQKKNEGNF